MRRYKAIRGRQPNEGGVVVLTIPGEPDQLIQAFETLAEVQARADQLNAIEEAKEAE